MNRTSPSSPSGTAVGIPGARPPQPWVTAATVTFVALALFAATINSGTFIRTPETLTHLPLLSHARHLPTIFSQHFMAFTGGEYRPLPYALIALARTVVSADNVVFWHLWLVGFHVLNAVLVYAVARHFTERAGPALVALAVFLLHPLGSAFGNQIDLFPLVLAGSFYLGSFLCYLDYAQWRGTSVYLLALVLFAGGLLSSHALVTLPVLMLLYELLYARTGVFRTIGRLLPFGVCTVLAGYCYLTFHPHLLYYVYPPKPYAGVSRYWMHSFTSGGLDAFLALVRGWGARAPVSGLLGRMHDAWRPAGIVVGVVLVVWLLVSLWALRRRHWLAIGTFLLMVAVLPRFVRGQNLTMDYASWSYRYLPFVGFALLVGAVVEALLRGGGIWRRRCVTAAALIVVIVYGGLLAVANTRSRSPVGYWTHALSANPGSEIASVQLGKAYLAEGNEKEAKKYLFSPAVHRVRESCVAMARHYVHKGNALAAGVHLDLGGREGLPGLWDQDLVPLTAELLQRMEAFDFVEQFLGMSLMSNPDNPDALTRMAEVLATKGYLRAAVVYARKAVWIQHNHVEAVRLLVDLKKRFYEPETCARTTRAGPPPPGLLRYLSEQVAAEDVRSDIMALTDVLPDDPVVQLIGSLFLAEAGREEQALTAVDRALASLPSYPFARAAKCWIAQKAGEMDLALDTMKQVGEVTPQDADRWHTVGRKRAQAGQHELGIACFRTALRADPCLPGAHVDLAALLAREGKYLDALHHYREALPLMETESELVYSGMGYVLRRLGEQDEAVTYFRKAITIDAKSAAPYRNIAQIFEDRQRLDECSRVLSQGLEQVPNDVGLRSDLAKILAAAPEDELRDGPRAVRLAEGAVRDAETVTPQMLDVLAAAYAEAGRFDSAVVTAGQAAALARSQRNPTLAAGIDGRMRLYRQQKPFRMFGGRRTPGASTEEKPE
ncbi:MAG TPA: tetratricopeptide repeat protein [Planctomycetota bacterium]|nr:tetratricopeptide repeat protein [Planctomycetota bacterium]